MKKQKQITVIAAASQEALEAHGAEIENTQVETIADAKRVAQYYLSETFRNATESSVRLGYSQVVVDDLVRYDYFAKETK